MEDLARIKISKAGPENIALMLRGEFDLRLRKDLQDILNCAVETGQWVSVDLSGVTFLDRTCLMELLVSHQIHESRLTLCNPSWQVRLGVMACELEDWMTFCESEDFSGKRTSKTREVQRGTL